jgi:hypothetical protein
MDDRTLAQISDASAQLFGQRNIPSQHEPVPQTLSEAAVLECYAERVALTVRRAANFTDCLMQHHLAPQITVTSTKGVPFVLHGKDLCHAGTWRKFLAATPLAQSLLCQLVKGSEELTRRYRSFLLSAYTRRYRALVQPEHLAWFRSVTRLAVLWHMMEEKAERSAFADPWVAQEMQVLLLLNTLSTEIAKAIHHIVKEPKDEATHLIDQLYHVHAAEISHPRLAPPPLPPLPGGVSLPLSLGDGGEQHQDEETEEMTS